MRAFLLLPALPLVVGLIAWAQYDAQASVRVVILESLTASTASEVLPIFEAELETQMAVERRWVRFVRIHVAADGGLPALERDRLAAADLVVSFGSAAAETGSRALRGTTTPHLFAYLPRDLALALTDASTGAGRGQTTGIAGQLPRGAAFAIAAQLLGSRDAPPLRIGLVHQVSADTSTPTIRLLAEATRSPDFVSVPFVVPAEADTAVLVERVVAAAAAAATGELAVDAFWLALDATAPLEVLVQAIEQHTGQLVVYAPSQAAVAAGALMSLAPEPRSTALEAAILAKRMLDGGVPAGLPVRAPHRVDFSLNLDTADALGLVPSHELMELARGRLFR